MERALYALSESEIPSATVGELVMDELAKVDQVAYVRFASVYRKFKDIESFEKELDQIKTRLQ